MGYTAVVLLTGFYLGIGFSGYLSAVVKLRWRYNVFAHMIMSFTWGIFGARAIYVKLRFWFVRKVLQRS